jgi:hypothetical protein
MRFEKVPTTPVFHARCLGCGKHTAPDDRWADLDGQSFQDYYCGWCKDTILSQSPAEREEFLRLRALSSASAARALHGNKENK